MASQRDRLLAVLNAQADDDYVRVVWADGTWALLTVAELHADFLDGAVCDLDEIDHLEFC